MVDAIRASIAIPGVLPPVPFGTDLLVDGGVLHNLPVHLVSDDPSIGTVIASDVAPPVGPGAPSDFGLSVSGWAVARRRLRRRTPRSHPRLSAVLMRSMLIGSARRSRSPPALGGDRPVPRPGPARHRAARLLVGRARRPPGLRVGGALDRRVRPDDACRAPTTRVTHPGTVFSVISVAPRCHDARYGIEDTHRVRLLHLRHRPPEMGGAVRGLR